MLDTIKPDARPLYAQVRDILIERIHTGTWSPGQSLPSEMSLAAELGVSQGTVRKALNTMADDSIIERRQGKGTYVTKHTSTQVLFKFFQIYEANGNRIEPGTGKSKLKINRASKEVARSLKLKPGEEIIEITRLRTHNNNPIIDELIILPRKLFSGLELQKNLPNTLYDFYQRDYAITVSEVEENLTASVATKKQAKELNLKEGAPLLVIDRIAADIEQTPIERRISYCTTDNLKYVAKLR